MAAADEPAAAGGDPLAQPLINAVAMPTSTGVARPCGILTTGSMDPAAALVKGGEFAQGVQPTRGRCLRWKRPRTAWRRHFPLGFPEPKCRQGVNLILPLTGPEPTDKVAF